MNEEYDYLEFLNDISDAKFMGVYGLDDMRAALHLAILKKNGYQNLYSRSKHIFDHLDMAIGFSPPLTPGDKLKPYAEELNRLLGCTECQYYMEEKTFRLNTEYGTLENGVWTKRD